MKALCNSYLQLIFNPFIQPSLPFKSLLQNPSFAIQFKTMSIHRFKLTTKLTFEYFCTLENMLNKRFYISWITGAVLMYVLFYFWHGVVLNDLNKIAYPKGIFLTFAAVTYLFISLIVFKAFHFKPLKDFISNNFYRAIVAGSITGIVLYMASVVLGISFSPEFSLRNLMLDCGWQMIEQTAGAMIVLLAQFFIYIPEFEN